MTAREDFIQHFIEGVRHELERILPEQAPESMEGMLLLIVPGSGLSVVQAGTMAGTAEGVSPPAAVLGMALHAVTHHQPAHHSAIVRRDTDEPAAVAQARAVVEQLGGLDAVPGSHSSPSAEEAKQEPPAREDGGDYPATGWGCL
ncbi:MAG: hypothetical protein AB7G21_09710 [Dehalococcoidia bacterium]